MTCNLAGMFSKEPAVNVCRMMSVQVLLFILGCNLVLVASDYEVPDATIEVYTPRGFRVSIPDEEGIKLFAFHGKINEEMNGREAGTFSRDITKAKNGRWTFVDTTTTLKPGDILYYWTFVDYFDGQRKLGYVKDDQSFTVKELLPNPNIKVTTKRPVTTTTIDPNVCLASVTTVRGKPSCKGHLIFDSRFDQFSSNKEKYWTVQRKFAVGPDYEFVIYEDNSKTLSVQNGHLVISPVLTDSVYGEGYVTEPRGLDLGPECTGVRASPECYQKPQSWYIIPPVISSQITTKGKFSFKYGKIEIRAKLPQGDWLYPELFLNSETEDYGPNYESGQIRIAFAVGNDGYNRKLQGGVILGKKPAAREYGIKTLEKNTPWTNDFHTYSVLWTPESIFISVDGSVYGTIYPPEAGFTSLGNNLGIRYADRWKTGSHMAPFDKEMVIVLGVGAGGHNFEDRSDGTKPWINKEAISQKDFYKARSSWYPTWSNGGKLEVDYVKVWAI